MQLQRLQIILCAGKQVQPRGAGGCQQHPWYWDTSCHGSSWAAPPRGRCLRHTNRVFLIIARLKALRKCSKRPHAADRAVLPQQLLFPTPSTCPPRRPGTAQACQITCTSEGCIEEHLPTAPPIRRGSSVSQGLSPLCLGLNPVLQARV